MLTEQDYREVLEEFGFDASPGPNTGRVGRALRFRQKRKMEDPNNTRLIEVSAFSLDIDDILASLSDDAGLSNSLRSASVLVVPTDLVSEYEEHAFPLSTRERL